MAHAWRFTRSVRLSVCAEVWRAFLTCNNRQSRVAAMEPKKAVAIVHSGQLVLRTLR